MAYGIIYIATNTVNGKQYVGQTRYSLKIRWQLHLRAIRDGSTSALHQAIRKYGVEAFEIKQLDSAETLKDLNDKEVLHISQLRTLAPGGYNLTTGGETRLFSVEAKRKMSMAAIGRVPSDETRAKISEAGKNRTMSRGIRQKISKKLQGHTVSEETRRKLSEAALFRKVR
jgi:group I intron endonuclease